MMYVQLLVLLGITFLESRQTTELNRHCQWGSLQVLRDNMTLRHHSLCPLAFSCFFFLLQALVHSFANYPIISF